MDDTTPLTSGDDLSKLAASTVLSLKQFRVFPGFTTDRLKADKLLSNETTNALKYEKSKFRFSAKQ